MRRHGTYSARAALVALRRLGPGDDLTFASSIAYYALLSFFPLLLLFSLLARLTGDPAVRAALVDLLLLAALVLASVTEVRWPPSSCSFCGSTSRRSF